MTGFIGTVVVFLSALVVTTASFGVAAVALKRTAGQ